MFQKLKAALIQWLTYEPPNRGFPLCDFERILYEVRPCDVLLIEGRSHVSNVIKQITQSPWSHSCLYIGRVHDIDDKQLQNKLIDEYHVEPNVQLVIEGFLGKGTILTPLETYRQDHIRICRPRGLSRQDAQEVIAYALGQLGKPYDVRQIFDLARFLIPWSFMPGRWRSSLFEKHIGENTKTVCSTMIAEAFAAVDFPILPSIKKHEETGIELIQRNPKLFTPRDFDYSPFFEIIKYPFIELTERGIYRNLPWSLSQESEISPEKAPQKSSQEEDPPSDPTSPEPQVSSEDTSADSQTEDPSEEANPLKKKTNLDVSYRHFNKLLWVTRLSLNPLLKNTFLKR